MLKVALHTHFSFIFRPFFSVLLAILVDALVESMPTADAMGRLT
jgi:hypothetical protein